MIYEKTLPHEKSKKNFQKIKSKQTLKHVLHFQVKNIKIEMKRGELQ